MNENCLKYLKMEQQKSLKFHYIHKNSYDQIFIKSYEYTFSNAIFGTVSEYLA